MITRNSRSELTSNFYMRKQSIHLNLSGDEKEIQDDEIDISFIADFPGLVIKNYLAPDLDNTTVELLGE